MWKYTFDKPADGWEKSDFDDADWQAGLGGFGTRGTPGATVGTEWNGRDIWLRRLFILDKVPENWQLLIHHDEDAEIYLNGQLLKRLAGYTTSYMLEEPDAQATGAQHKGSNVLAVHCKQTGGGQFIDVGLVEVIEQSDR